MHDLAMSDVNSKAVMMLWLVTRLKLCSSPGLQLVLLDIVPEACL